MTDYRNDAPRRDLKKQAVSADLTLMEATYARACTASAEYILVRVPIVKGVQGLDIDHSGLEDWQSRFVLANITPREYDVENGQAPINVQQVTETEPGVYCDLMEVIKSYKYECENFADNRL